MPHRGVTPDRIVATAADIADRDGLSATSLSAVAQELGVRVPSLYKHVDGLDDVLRRVGDEAAADLAAQLARSVDGKAGREALLAAATGYRGWAQAHPGRYAAIALGSGVADVRDEVRRVVAGYDLDGDTATHAGDAVYCALHGFAMVEAGDGLGDPARRDASFYELVALLDRGLAEPGSAAQPRGLKLPGLPRLPPLPGLSSLPFVGRSGH